jgi:hypothetical protein
MGMVKESVWHRAWRDTENFRNSAKFFWIWEVMGATVAGVIGGIIGAWQIPENSGTLQQYLYPAIGGAVGIIVGAVIVFVLIFIWHLFRVPYRQRDEAIELAKQVQQKYDSILSVVRHNLAFNAPALRTTIFPDSIAVQVGAEFRNTCQEMIEFKVTKFKVILAGKTVENPKFSTSSGFISPSQVRQYYFESIKLDGKPERFLGTLEYEVLYSSVPNTQWYKSARKMSLEFRLEGVNLKASYQMEEELEE